MLKNYANFKGNSNKWEKKIIQGSFKVIIYTSHSPKAILPPCEAVPFKTTSYKTFW